MFTYRNVQKVGTDSLVRPSEKKKSGATGCRALPSEADKRQKHVFFSLLFLLTAFGGMILSAQEKSDQPNLIKNGGFEDVRPITEEELRPFQSLGWKVEGKLQLPRDWQLVLWNKDGSNYERTFRGGVIEVVEQPGEAKQGARCLRLVTSGGQYARTSVKTSFMAKSGKTFSWSYWARAAGGTPAFNDPSKIAWGRILQLIFEYQTPSGKNGVTVPLWEDARVPDTWKQYSGVATLGDLKPDSEVTVKLVACQDDGPKISTIWVDDVAIAPASPQPQATPASNANAPEVKKSVQVPLVSRSDYRIADFWQIPAVCGRTYWMLVKPGWLGNVNQKERVNKEIFPRAQDVLSSNCGAAANSCVFNAPRWVHPQGPFFVTGLRWGGYGYAEEWHRKYGADIPLPTVTPAVPPEGVKTLKENGNDLLKQYGERYLGIELQEWDNDILNTVLKEPSARMFEPERRKKLLAYLGELGCAQIPPKTREQAVQCVETMFKVVKEAHGDHFFALTSTGINDHYAMEFGSLIAAAETTSALGERVRFRTASARGAAREYGKPWLSYMVNAVDSPLGEISDTLFFRELIHGYAAGCSLYEQETDFADYLRDKNVWVPNEGYIEKLSRAMRYFNSDNDRGAPYTPILLGLDWLHAFNDLPPHAWSRNDAMIPKVGEALMPSHGKEFVKPEFGKARDFVETDNLYLSNSSFGDVFDLMILNPPSDRATLEKLNAYKVMVLLGEIRWTKKLAGRLDSYVKAGGTLFLAADQMATSPEMAWCGSVSTAAVFASRSVCDKDGNPVAGLPEGRTQTVYEITSSLEGAEVIYTDENKHPLVVRRPVGGGSVIMCLVTSMLDKEANWDVGQVAPAALATLQRLHDESLPFKIEGDVEFTISRGKTSWTVTLINNRGITKPPPGPITIDRKKTAIVTVTPKIPVPAVSELLVGDVNNILRGANGVNRITVAVPPGDVRVLRFND